MREIITIQVGNFANYIGSHFWNFQDELLGLAGEAGDALYKNHSLNMDVLYRSGEHQGFPTYTPRLISVGTQGSLGSLCSSSVHSGSSPSDASTITTWKGKISRQVAEQQKRNLFLKRLYEEEQAMLDENQKEVKDKDIVESLENEVYYWTDFSKVQYHPRSLFALHASWTDMEELDNYGSGGAILSDGFQGEEMNERLRYFVEECDSIQGIQFILDDSGGFSSVAAAFMEGIADDYSKTPVLLYTPRSPASVASVSNQKPSVARALHDAVSFSQLSSYCQLIIPISLSSFNTSKVSDFLCIDDTKLFHSSAVYAASINTISLPSRMELLGPTANSKSALGAMDIGELVQVLSGQGWENMVAILEASMPVPSLDGNDFDKSFYPLNDELAKDEAEDLQAVESVVIQGAFQSGRRASISEAMDALYEANQNRGRNPRLSHLASALCPLPIPLCFPAIFRDPIGKHGELLDNPVHGTQPKGPLEVESIPMGARLRSSRAILPFIEKRLTNLRRFGIQRGAPGMQLLRTWGFSKTEVEELVETLLKMVRTLDPHPDLSSDSD